MKKKLLVLCTISLVATTIHSQDLVEQTTDANGKIHFKSINTSKSILEKNEKSTTDLELDWTNPDYNVSDHPEVDSWNPRMSVSPDGTAHIVYNDNHPNGLQKIMYRKKSPSGDWSTPIFIDKGGEIEDRNNHYPTIVTSENGDLHATYNVWAFENFRNYIGYSHYDAATETWSDGVKISDLGGTVSHSNGRHELFTTSDGLPVAVWGWDNRENDTDEEIYLSYFDGTSWSNDIAVSDLNDGFNAGAPHVESLGNGKTMILFTQDISGGKELGYKLYDETTHELSDFKTLPVTDYNGFNYSIASSGNDDIHVLTLHSELSPLRASFTVYTYDSAADIFEVNSSPFEVDAPDGNIKRIDLDCNENGDCAIIYTDFYEDSNMYMSYNETDGFSTPFQINDENPAFEAPTCEFDAAGNLHVVWNDKRFDDGVDFDEREVIYELGVNSSLSTISFEDTSMVVYPNPTQGEIHIQTQGNYSLQIFDLLGRSISTQEVNGATTINTITKSGTYFLQFTGNNEVVVKKVIVQ